MEVMKTWGNTRKRKTQAHWTMHQDKKFVNLRTTILNSSKEIRVNTRMFE